jgi:hypothetical protein
VRARGNVAKRLGDVRGEVRRLRDELRVLEEQLAYVAGLADEAAVRAVVSSTPLADRERRQVEDDLRRIRRERDETATRVDALLAEQDELLDRLAAAEPASGP